MVIRCIGLFSGSRFRKPCFLGEGGTFKNLKTFFKNMTMKEVSEKSDLDVILKQNKQVLALFCSSWCPFCRSFFPTFNMGITKHRFEKVIRVYLEEDDNPLWEEYSIEAVPTAILFEKGHVSRRLDARLGMGLGEKQFMEWLEKIKS